MSSYFKQVEDEQERRAYFDAGLLYYKLDGERDYREETFIQWEQYQGAWGGRRHNTPPWESYILIEDDTEEATCPSP